MCGRRIGDKDGRNKWVATNCHGHIFAHRHSTIQQDWSVNSSPPKLDSSLHVNKRYCVGTRGENHLGDFCDTEAICIRLQCGEYLRVCPSDSSDHPDVVRNGVQIDLEAVWSTEQS